METFVIFAVLWIVPAVLGYYLVRYFRNLNKYHDFSMPKDAANMFFVLCCIPWMGIVVCFLLLIIFVASKLHLFD